MTDYPHQPKGSGAHDFAALVEAWRGDGWERLFRPIWLGYQDLYDDPDIDLSWNNENQVTSRLLRRVRKFWPANSAFGIEPQEGNEEGRKSKYGLPPTPDITISVHDSQMMAELHLEAKVIHHERDLRPYLDEIGENFCKGRYCPRSSVGGLLGYCLGDFPDLSEVISQTVGVKLERQWQFNPNRHFASFHARSGPLIVILSERILLHHLFMPGPND